MRLMDLWPTRVVITEIPLDICAKLYDKYVQTGSKDYEDILDEDSANYLKNQVDTYFLAEHEICDGWIRTLSTSSQNDFELHCDNHYGNQIVGVLQLFGDQDCGGEINLYDPAWRNPQFVSDRVNKNSNKFTVPFIPGQFIIFPANVWHSVNAYTGETPRSTLNLMIRRVA